MTYSYGDPAGKNNVPNYTGPTANYQWAIDYMKDKIGGPAGMPGVLDKVRGLEPTSFMGSLPWGGGQINQFAGNMISGKRADRISGDWSKRATEDLNRTAYKGYKAMSGKSAAMGGRGSSADAVLKAQGLGEYQGARNDIMNKEAMLNEDVRRADRGFGMNVLGAEQAGMNSDWTNQMNNANLQLSSLYPELQAWGQGLSTAGNVAGNEAGQQNSQNAWNNNIWGQLFNKQKGPNGWDIFGQVAGAALPFVFPPAAAATPFIK